MKQRVVTLLLCLLLLCPCASLGDGNPAVYLTTDAQRETLSTLRNIDEGRFYVMDYTADYKLHEIIACNACTPEELLSFAQNALLSGAPASAKVGSCGCSSFTAKTMDGARLSGRNHDYLMDTTAVLVRTSPKDGYRSLNMTSAGWVGYDIGTPDDGNTDLSALMMAPYLTMDGVNEKGLAVTALSVGDVPTRQSTGKPKVSTTVVIRMLLDRAANVDEALTLLEQVDFQSTLDTESNHFFLADAAGRAVVVEYCPDEMKVLHKTYVTNFYLSPSMNGQYGVGQDRYDILKSALTYQHSRLSVGQAMSLLSLLSLVSQEPKDYRSQTQWSAVYNLTEPGVTVAIRCNYDKLFSFSMDDLSGQ